MQCANQSTSETKDPKENRAEEAFICDGIILNEIDKNARLYKPVYFGQ
ncbi:hypothetical protein SAMN04489868_1204 [Pisciglobus halotolerans]|uniref:Uncharacterized protein n=1 Tax=Pisciglobus halotolerans TaxID=745365 RepID=A0A1I3CM24_9LACT|nr:hypothetical protein SAMN04489868_1204 [Pisciglobus halotolerans]